MPEYSVVGKPLPRIDGLVKVTGQATYAADLALPGMLYGKILRSPYAHAKILNIDTSRAEKLRGVRAVITGKDFPGIPYGHMPFSRDQLPLAMEKVRHVGEGVAAVAAVDEDTAEDALDLIEVEYEQLPIMLTVEEAMKEGAPRIHERSENNIAFTANYHWGDVEKGFSESDYVREERFNTHRATTGFIEPHAVLASADASGRITLQASKQSPYITWRHFCRAMDLPLSKVRIITPYIGGGFSGKHEPFDLDFAAARMAQKTLRPVKIVLNQDEVLSFFKQRQQKNALIKIGARKDGTLMACDCKVIAEGGAYAYQTAFQLWIFCNYMNFPYRLPNLRFEATRVYTNNIPSGTVYGHGGTAGRYVYESMLSVVADDLGIDQLEIRLKNALRAGDTTAHGQAVDFVTVDRALALATDNLGSAQIRNLATLAGNLCNAAPCADTTPPLIALGVRLKLISSKGERTVPVEEFFLAPFESALQKDELLGEIEVPNQPSNSRGVYLKHNLRGAMEYPLVGIAVVLHLEGKVCRAVKITGSFCSHCWRREGCRFPCPTPFSASTVTFTKWT